MTPKTVTAQQMRQIDRRAIQEYGIPVLVLMENAGRAVAEAAQKLLEKKTGNKVIVLCGGGNNGGDGVVAARYLHQWGYNATVYWLKDPEQWTGDLGQHFQIAKKYGVPFEAWAPLKPPSFSVGRSPISIVEEGVDGTSEALIPAPGHVGIVVKFLVRLLKIFPLLALA